GCSAESASFTVRPPTNRPEKLPTFVMALKMSLRFDRAEPGLLDALLTHNLRVLRGSHQPHIQYWQYVRSHPFANESSVINEKSFKYGFDRRRHFGVILLRANNGN